LKIKKKLNGENQTIFDVHFIVFSKAIILLDFTLGLFLFFG